jgi:hypothetical protein
MHKIVLYLRPSPRVWNIGNPKSKKTQRVHGKEKTGRGIRSWGFQHTGNIATPDRSVMATVSTQALSVVRVPHSGSMILGTREEQVPISVVLEKGQRPLVALQQNRPHQYSPLFSPLFPLPLPRSLARRHESRKQRMAHTGGKEKPKKNLITTHCFFPH